MTRLAAIPLLLALAAPAVADDHPVVALVKPKLKDPAKPFVMLVTVKVKAGAADKFEAGFKEATAATRKEAGSLVYQLNKDADHPDTYVVYERWKSLDALKTHLETDYIKKLLAGLPDLTDGAPDIKVLIPAGE